MVAVRPQGGAAKQKSINARIVQCIDGGGGYIVFDCGFGLPQFGGGGWPGGGGGGGGGRGLVCGSQVWLKLCQLSVCVKQSEDIDDQRQEKNFMKPVHLVA